MSIARDSGCEFRCEIIGDGPLQNDLQAQVAQAGLEPRITLVGSQSQEKIHERLAAAHLFVLPCVKDKAGGSDNLPTVIAEAMAAGLPVVSTSIAGIPEMVQHNVTGELVSPNDPPALATAIERVITDLPRARQLGARGFEAARAKFSIVTSVQSLLGIFNKLPRVDSTPSTA